MPPPARRSYLFLTIRWRSIFVIEELPNVGVTLNQFRCGPHVDARNFGPAFLMKNKGQ